MDLHDGSTLEKDCFGIAFGLVKDRALQDLDFLVVLDCWGFQISPHPIDDGLMG